MAQFNQWGQQIIGKFTGKSGSRSGWEKSHFGGVQKLIWDYPMVNLSWKVDIQKPNSIHLQHYAGDKLVKIVLSQYKKSGRSLGDLLDGKLTEVPSPLGPKLMGKSKPGALSAAAHRLMAEGSELTPLFEEYMSFLNEASFTIKMDKPQGGQGGGQGEKGEEQEKGEGQGEGQQGEGQEGDGQQGEGQEGDGQQGDGQQGEGQEGQGQEGEGQDGKSGEGEGQQGSGQQGEGQSGKGGEGQQMNAAMLKQVLQEMKDLLDEISEGQKYSSYVGKKGTTIGNVKDVTWKHVPKSRKRRTTFSAEERFNGEQLLKMLDISWDPDVDVVKSLRTGQIDPTKICEIPSGNLAVYQRTLEEQTTKPFSVVILVDESGSMGSYYRDGGRTHSAYHTIKSLYWAFNQLLPEDKLWVYGHSGHSAPRVDIYKDPYSPDFEMNFDHFIDVGREYNYDGVVIQEIHKRVREHTDDRIIFLVLSDGQPNGPGSSYGSQKDIDDMKRIVEKARRDDFVTVGIFMQYEGTRGLYQHSVVINNLKTCQKMLAN